MIHRIAYRDWKFVEYYLSEVINYCSQSEMINQHFADEVSVSRIQKYNEFHKINQENSCGNSFVQNLSLAIKHENFWCAIIQDFFHFDFGETKN